MKKIYFIIGFTSLVFLILMGCTKDYKDMPTCHRYLELADRCNGKMAYIRTDTIYPNGINGNVVCGNDIGKLEGTIDTVGCTQDGYTIIHYKIIR